jgi:uncharacterized protein DUF2255
VTVLKVPKGFEEALEREQEVTITFVKKNGKKRTIPIWFAVNGRTIELLPMYGSKTKWYEDVSAAGSVQLKVGGEAMTATPRATRDPKVIDGIKMRFGAKYGEADVRKYYPNQDVALEVQL